MTPIVPSKRAARVFHSILAALAVGAAAPLAAAHSADPSAVWVPRKLTFIYQGFTSHYSCNGLRDQMRYILERLGARKEDLHLRQIGCRGFNQPEPSPGVEATFFVLQPVGESAEAGAAASSSSSRSTAAAGEASGPPIAAQWRQVQLGVGHDPLAQAGHCELIEQVERKVLPLFATRDLHFTDNCYPHALNAAGTYIKVQVLEPVAGAGAGPSSPGAAADFRITPEKGQTAAQAARDRTACRRWASSQTGFDPSAPSEANAQQGAGASRANYLDAMRACLSARGYAVQ